MENMRILIVDDSVIVRTVVKQQLINVNKEFKIEEAGNGREGWEKMIKGNFLPDLCLLDIHMPEENGIELAKKIRKFPALSNCLILFISFDAHRDIVMQVKELGPIGYLIKPYTTQKLKEYLDRAQGLKIKNEKIQSAMIVYDPDKIRSELNLDNVAYVKLVEALLEQLEALRDKIQILWNEKKFIKIEGLMQSEMKTHIGECVTLGLYEYAQLAKQIIQDQAWQTDTPLLLHLLMIAAIRVQGACEKLLPVATQPVPTPQQEKKPTEIVKEITDLELLLPNMILDQDLRDPSGLLILPKDQVLKERTIRKIKDYYGAQLISQMIKVRITA